MAKQTIEARVIQKVATEQEWLQDNLVLYKGEIALVSSDDNVVNMKVGDGVHTFAELEYMYRGGFQGSINPTTTTSTLINGFYFAETSGTYTNANNVVVNEGYYTILEKNDSGWKVASSVKMPMQDLTLLENKIDNVADEVDSKLNQIAEEVETVRVVEDDTYSGRYYDSENHLFSGFGFNYGKLKNFNRITLKLSQRENTTQLFNRILITIRENNYQGAILYQNEKSINIPDFNIVDFTVDIPTILNENDSDIYIEYVVNGFSGVCAGGKSTQPYRYVANNTTSTQLQTLEQRSLAGNSDNTPFYVKFEKVEKVYNLNIPEFSETISEEDENAPKSKTVYNYLNNIVEEVFELEEEILNPNPIKSTSNSTFASWGQLFGKLKNFNRVGYVVNAYDVNNIPSQLNLVIRKDSFNGEIIYDLTKDVTLQHNVEQRIYFDLPDVFENLDNNDIFISIVSNGYISAYTGGNTLPNGERPRYAVQKGDKNLTSLVVNDYQLCIFVLRGEKVIGLSENQIQKIKNEMQGFKEPDLLLTSKVWLMPNLQYNIYNKNVVIPDFGDNLINYRLDYNGNKGQQFNRGYRYTAEENINQNITLNVMQGRKQLLTKVQNILTPALNSGNGNTRKVLIIGDSTVNGSNISTPLKNVFDTDVMNIELIGTIGSNGVKHEGRGGWTINDYATFGRKLFVVPVNGITTIPSVGAVYKQTAGNDFSVVEVNITGGSGYFSVQMTSGSVDLATNGTLTKVSGNGDSVINYSGSSLTSANPFYNSTTDGFDLGFYLANTSQSLSSNDWIFFQLGINDVFNISDLQSAENKTTTMLNQLKAMRANIKAYNANIRVGIVVTFPPADQDAFGFSYSVGQTSEMYTKTGLLTWQKKLIAEFDNDTERDNGTYLVSAHLNLDTDYNYPTSEVAANSRNTKTLTMQNNGVHPAASGYAQIADMYAGLIKYFG